MDPKKLKINSQSEENLNRSQESEKESKEESKKTLENSTENSSSKKEEKNSSKKLKVSAFLKKKEEPYFEEYQKLKEEHLYLRAEFENYKRRALEEKRQFQLYEGEGFISDLAEEVLDDFERALASLKDNRSLTAMQKGLEMIHTKFKLLFKKYGVSSLDPQGQAFDPSYQEALSHVESSKFPEGYVLETYKKAYKLHDKVIRPAQVVVTKSKS